MKETKGDVRALSAYKKARLMEDHILQKEFSKHMWNIANENDIRNTDLKVFDVPIELRGKQTFIHTHESGDSSNPNVLLLLHGYFGTCVQFAKMQCLLSSKFRVFSIDFIGMGLSGRDDFHVESMKSNEVIDFFVECIEKWRLAVNLKRFTGIIAHSFGGYIAMNYGLRNRQLITNSIVLLSPMGATCITDENDLSIDANYNKFQAQQTSLFDRVEQRFWRFIGKNKYTPNRFFNQWYMPRSLVLKISFKKRFEGCDQQTIDLLVKYYTAMLQLPESTDACIHSLIRFPMAQAFLSLEELLILEEQTHRYSLSSMKNIECVEEQSTEQKKEDIDDDGDSIFDEYEEEEEERVQQIGRNAFKPSTTLGLPFYVHTIFGEMDWMDSQGIVRCYAENRISGTFYIVPNVDHQLDLQQRPEELVRFVINRLGYR